LQSDFQNFIWLFENGQKKCPKSKSQNTFWKLKMLVFWPDRGALEFVGC
jgi:hypothetical protein